jgi:O-6-methylguanine DNA methyltransferase
MARATKKRGQRFEVSTIKTPMGTLFAVSQKERLCALSFLDTWPSTLARICKRFRTQEYVEAQLFDDIFAAYFDKDFSAFESIRLDTGGTIFQRKVWRQLSKIEAGCTKTYGDIARSLGKQGAARAVGQAAHRNPIAIVIPCHRCVGHKGLLTGYAAGIERKRWLLEHEGSLLI